MKQKVSRVIDWLRQEKGTWCRVLLLLGAVGCGLRAVWQGAMWLFAMWLTGGETAGASVGIIGGADGPTAVFVTGATSIGAGIAQWLLLAAVLGAAYWFLRPRKK